MSIVSVLHKQRSPKNLLHNNMSILNNTDLTKDQSMQKKHEKEKRETQDLHLCL